MKRDIYMHALKVCVHFEARGVATVWHATHKSLMSVLLQYKNDTEITSYCRLISTLVTTMYIFISDVQTRDGFNLALTLNKLR